MKDIKEMKEEDLIKALKAIRKEIDRHRFEAWEKQTGFRYSLKKIKREVVNEKRRA